MEHASTGFGGLLRDWRQRRRMSQLDLALTAEISQRHLSFVESGRSQPSRDMVLRLAEHLDVPARERNTLLVAAGFAPVHPERALDDPAMAAAREAVGLVLTAYEPFPALAVDRHWTMLAANAGVARLIAGVAPEMLTPPVNALRLSLHPAGLAPRIVNFGHWRGHILARLGRQVEQTADPVLRDLRAELEALPVPHATARRPLRPSTVLADVAVPFELATPAGILSFLSTTTVFGTPVDITLAELAIEAFLPADAATAEALRAPFRD